MPAVRVERPRPAVLKVTPVMFSVDLPVSLNVRFSVSPFSRLMPLKDESCDVVLICCRTLLYCATRLVRVRLRVRIGDRSSRRQTVEGLASCRGGAADRADRRRSRIVGGHDVDLAGRGRCVACRLFAASAVLSWLSVEIWPEPVPKVMLVAVPPPVAPIVSVSPLSAGAPRLVVPAARPKAAERAGAAGGDDQMLRRARADQELACRTARSRRLHGSAGDRVDRGEQALYRQRAAAPTPIVTLPLPSVVTVVCAGAEGDGLAVDGNRTIRSQAS